MNRDLLRYVLAACAVLLAGSCRAVAQDEVEWYLPGLGTGFTRVAASADGAMIATGGADVTIKLWDVSTGRFIRNLFGHRHGAAGLAFDSTGRVLVSAGFDSTVRVWDVSSGRQIDSMLDHTSPLRWLAISRDGMIVASGGRDSTVIVWNRASGERRRLLSEATDGAAALTADGSAIAIARDGGRTIDLIDIATLALRHAVSLVALDGGELHLRRLFITPDDASILYWADWRPTARTPYRVRTGRVELDGGRVIWQRIDSTGYSGELLALSPDGTTIVTSSSFRLCVGDASRAPSDSCERSLMQPQTSSFLSVAFLPDRDRLVVGSIGDVAISSVTTGFPVWSVGDGRGVIPSLAFERDGETFHVIHGSDVQLRSTWSGDVLAKYSDGVDPGSVEPTPDGRYVVIEHFNRVEVIERATRKVAGLAFKTFFNSGESDVVVTSGTAFLDVSPTGLEALMANGDGTVVQIELPSGRTLRVIGDADDYRAAIIAAVYSPDGRRIATATHEGAIVVHDAASGAELRRFDFVNGRRTPLAWSPDGRHLAAGSDSGRVVIRDVEAGGIVSQRQAHTGDVRALVYDPDGSVLISAGADGRVVEWEIASGREVVHGGYPVAHRALALAPDGARFVAATNDGSLLMRRTVLADGAGRTTEPPPSTPSTVGHRVLYAPRRSTEYETVWVGLLLTEPLPMRSALYDVRGRAVRAGEEYVPQAGYELVSVDLEGLASGNYFWTVTVGGTAHTWPVVVVR